jgi:hypothetical protein
MAEWLKAHAWKACIPKGIQGSNPCLSASKKYPLNMDHNDTIVLLFRLVIVLGLVLWFMHYFRGRRPPTPMHPLPTDDSLLLRKKRRRTLDAEVRRWVPGMR